MSISRRDALGMIGSALALPGLLRLSVTEAVAASAITPQGAAFRLDGNQTGGQRRPRLAAFADGRFLATWTQDPPAADERGFRRAFGLNGTALNSPLAGIPARINSAVPICFGNTTSLIVGSYNPGEAGSRIEARAYNASFGLTATHTIYLPDSGIGQFAVKACRLKNNTVLAAWINQQSISTMSALGAILGPDAKVHGSVKPITNGAETAEQPQAVAALTGGGAVVAYTASTSSNTYTDLLVQRLSASAGRIEAPIRLVRYPTVSLVKGIGLVGTSDGGFVAMWSESDPNGKSKLRWSVYDAGGAKLHAFSAINGVDGSVDAGPMLDRLSNGKIVAITAAVTGTGANRRYNVFAWSLLATGARSVGPVAIFTNTAPSHFPGSVAALNASTVAASFTGGGEDSGTQRALARRLQIS